MSENPEQTNQEPESIGDPELCIKLQKSFRAIAYWRQQDIGPKFYREGRTIRYLMTDVEDFIRSHSPRIKLSTDSADSVKGAEE